MPLARACAPSSTPTRIALVLSRRCRRCSVKASKRVCARRAEIECGSRSVICRRAGPLRGPPAHARFDASASSRSSDSCSDAGRHGFELTHRTRLFSTSALAAALYWRTLRPQLFASEGNAFAATDTDARSQGVERRRLPPNAPRCAPRSSLVHSQCTSSCPRASDAASGAHRRAACGERIATLFEFGLSKLWHGSQATLSAAVSLRRARRSLSRAHCLRVEALPRPGRAASRTAPRDAPDRPRTAAARAIGVMDVNA